MLNTTENFVIVIAVVAGALLFVRMLNWFWPTTSRRTHNALIGWQLSVLGTTYAVMMGFMLFTVWQNYGLASLNSDAEASALVNVYRLAEGLPAEQAKKLQQAAQKYADVVVERDWPSMAAGSSGTLESAETNAEMWRIVMSAKPVSVAESNAEDHALSELSELTGYRRTRQLQSTSRLPGVLWFVLILGGVATIVSSCMFGTPSGLLHGFQVGALALLVGMVLVAVADIDRPYQGGVHVRDAAFRRAQGNMKD